MAEHILRTVGGFEASSPWGHKTFGLSSTVRLRNNHHRGKYFSLITWGIVSGFIAQLGAVLPRRYWAILAFTKINWNCLWWYILPQNVATTTIIRKLSRLDRICISIFIPKFAMLQTYSSKYILKFYTSRPTSFEDAFEVWKTIILTFTFLLVCFCATLKHVAET